MEMSTPIGLSGRLASKLPAKVPWAWTVTAVLLLLGNILLDWVSFIHPIGQLNITPWNPNTGFSFAMVLLFGRKFLPCFIAAPLLADLILRGGELPLTVEVLSSIAYVSGYAIILYYIAPPARLFDLTLPTIKEVALLCGITCIGAAISASALVAVLAWFDYIDSSLLVAAFVRSWIGDAIGLAVVVPLILIVGARRLPTPRPVSDILKALSIVATVTVAFNLAAEAQFRLFYLIFLPIIWIAFVDGLPRTTMALTLTQIVVVYWMQATLRDGTAVVTFQIMLYLLTITGLFAGAVVSQSRHTEQLLQAQRESAEKFARLMSMGALGAAIAHEINQPLTAIGTYAEIVRRELSANANVSPIAAQAASKISSEVKRTAGIVRQMRELVALNRFEATPVALRDLLVAPLDHLRQVKSAEQAVQIRKDIPSNLPRLLVDRLPFEQVIANLLRNASEAVEAAGKNGGQILISAALLEPGRVCITIADNGPGFAAGFDLDGSTALLSTKPEGMGLGLMICRTIIEQLGGNLAIESSAKGAVVRVVVRAEQ